MPDNPFDAAVNAAGKFTTQTAKYALLSEIAKIEFDAGLVVEPLKIVALIESPLEKKTVLRNAALDFITQKKNYAVLPQIIKLMITADPQAKYFAGQAAILLLENNTPQVAAQITAVLRILKITDEPFDSDSVRYDFITKLLKAGGKEYKDAAKALMIFKSTDYSDWASLALLKSLADWTEWNEAEKIADSFSQPLRKSWAFLELSKIARRKNDDKKAAEYFSQAALLRQTHNSEQKEMHRTAVQLRILGKEALQNGDNKNGIELLEQAEAVAAVITLPLERVRQQLFIAKVLQEFRELSSGQDYVDVKILDDKTLSGIDRSRIIQWFIEARNKSGRRKYPDITWTQAIQTAAEVVSKTPFAASDELNQVKRIAEILRRFVQTQAESVSPPLDIPKDDVNRLSGEEYESYYYSPFAVEDCGC